MKFEFIFFITSEIILEYAPFHELKSWIKLDKTNWNYLLQKIPVIRHLFGKKIDWIMLSANPSAIHLLEKNPDKISWSCLSRNPAAIHLLEKNKKKSIGETYSQIRQYLINYHQVKYLGKQ